MVGYQSGGFGAAIDLNEIAVGTGTASQVLAVNSGASATEWKTLGDLSELKFMINPMGGLETAALMTAQTSGSASIASSNGFVLNSTGASAGSEANYISQKGYDFVTNATETNMYYTMLITDQAKLTDAFPRIGLLIDNDNMIVMRRNSATGDFYLETLSATSSTKSTEFTHDFSSLSNVRFQIKAASVTLYINGTQVAQNTTNIPTGNGIIRFDINNVDTTNVTAQLHNLVVTTTK